MLGYTEFDKKKTESLKPYIKSGEKCKVSGIIEFNSKFYREVIFSKKRFMRMRLENNGYLYLDDENKVVTDRTLLKDLVKLGYYYDIFFNADKAAGILSTLKTELDIQKDKNNADEIGEGLDFLLSQKVYAAERVKSVVIKMLNLKEKSNIILEELSNIIKIMRQQDLNFNLELLNKLYPYYEDILKLNFEKIIYISTIQNCIDEVIKEAEKKRKKWGVRIISNMVGKLIKVSDELSYYRRLIEIYSSVLHLNSNQYIKYLNNTNKEKIDKRISLVRC